MLNFFTTYTPNMLYLEGNKVSLNTFQNNSTLNSWRCCNTKLCFLNWTFTHADILYFKEAYIEKFITALLCMDTYQPFVPRDFHVVFCGWNNRCLCCHYFIISILFTQVLYNMHPVLDNYSFRIHIRLLIHHKSSCDSFSDSLGNSGHEKR